MILDKSIEYLQPHIQMISQTVLNVINSTRDRSQLHRAMFNRFADNNFQNNTFLSTLGLSIAAVHNTVTKKTTQGQPFNFQEEVEISCRYGVQLMYYNYILNDGAISSYCDNETKNAAHQYFGQYRNMMVLAQNVVSFNDVQQQQTAHVGFNNNSNSRPLIIGNSNGPVNGGNNNFPHLNMGSTRVMSDTELSDDLAQLGSTIKRKDPVIDSVTFSPANSNSFMGMNQKPIVQPQQVQQPAPIVNAVNALELTFGDNEMNRAEHRLTIGGNEFVIPVHTTLVLERDVGNAVAAHPHDDDVVKDSSIYLKLLQETHTSLIDFITMAKSTHLEMVDEKGNKSLVARFIGNYFDVLPTKVDINKYFEAISTKNSTYNNFQDHLSRMCKRLSSPSSDIPEEDKEDVFTLVLFIDKMATAIVNDQLTFIMGKGKISIDSFIDDWNDLNAVINADYQDKANEFFAIISNKFKASFLCGESITFVEDPVVNYTHVVSQHSLISVNMNSKFLGYKCGEDWVKVDSLKHPMLFKLINSCRSLASASGEYTVKDLIVTNDMVVYEIATRIDKTNWIRLMKV